MWWENDFLKVKSKELYLGGKAAAQIAKELGTPLFLYSKKQILREEGASSFPKGLSLEKICKEIII
jgi:uncharacterized protein YggU (UPF0235/DUF167 family)